MGPVQTRLERRIDEDVLIRDPEQVAAAIALDSRLQALSEYEPAKGGLLGRFFGGRETVPRGLYMYGGVGRGKSMLMDWFFEAADFTPKTRTHFHAFMLDVHERINAWRKLDKEGRRASPYHVRGAGDDPIAPVARAIASEAKLLCFDEFHVTDITDAMILSRLFEALWTNEGVVVIATSNRAPNDLYKQGLNRPLFEPFIRMMPDHLLIHPFEGDTDHRLRALTAAPIYYTPLDESATAAISAAWGRLTRDAMPIPFELTVQGRVLEFPKTARGVLWSDFAALCEENRSPAEFLEIAKAFHTVILENVPQMGADMRNAAKRFVTLIDALYESRTKLVMSAAVQPDQLYERGDGAFQFERTVSRLMEMRTEEYLGQEKS
ncbi:cell division protein ZapE [Litorimonas cladophorae]|uniref:Cell division protein ZapE n=1 Tax=Litorimonas cladophorae TaxID=1220491 RepID=A0A918KIH4_9PROT|nr:cell division protein ZapE [Litorimonas cladophorae]GGX63967.1 cell division protein ZapE [Litorimonas cladophorae]